MDFNFDEVLNTLLVLEIDEGFIPTEGRLLHILLLISHLCILSFVVL